MEDTYMADGRSQTPPTPRITTPPNAIHSDRASSSMIQERSSLKASIRYVLSACESLEREAKGRANSCPSLRDPTAREPLSALSTTSGSSLSEAQQAVCGECALMEDVRSLHECDDFRGGGGEEDELMKQELDAGEMRDVALQALAATPESDVEFLDPVTPPRGPSPQQQTPIPELSAPQIMISPPPSQVSLPALTERTPLPSLRTSLMPAPSPPGGYWTPSSTTEGGKNTPMCGPCKSGKKGQCFGGLPCDRCKEKGYSKERCEGSLVFRFGGRRKRRGTKELAEAGKKKVICSARQKRDKAGRFV